MLCGSPLGAHNIDRKSIRLNSSHMSISYAVFCLKKKNSGSPATSINRFRFNKIESTFVQTGNLSVPLLQTLVSRPSEQVIHTFSFPGCSMVLASLTFPVAGADLEIPRFAAA